MERNTDVVSLLCLLLSALSLSLSLTHPETHRHFTHAHVCPKSPRPSSPISSLGAVADSASDAASDAA